MSWGVKQEQKRQLLVQRLGKLKKKSDEANMLMEV